MRIIWTTILGATLLLSCDKDDDVDTHTDCEYMTIVSEIDYEATPTDNYIIDSAYVDDDCLIIRFGASGCNGNTWDISLFDAEQIMESYPPQRALRLSLTHSENCLAFITKTVSFDLSVIQIENADEVILNLDEYGTLLYEY